MILELTNEIKEFLIKRDSCFILLFKKYGFLRCSSDGDVFKAIVLHIIGQMLSKNAAQTIFNRFDSLCNHEITPYRITELEREKIRKCGISYSKADYILEFANDYLRKKYDFSTLENMDEKSIISCLTKIKGVGKWTAEMISLFVLGRTNVFSYDDVALRNGIMKCKHFRTLSKKRFEALRKKYSPFCSYASLYFYKCNDDADFK